MHFTSFSLFYQVSGKVKYKVATHSQANYLHWIKLISNDSINTFQNCHFKIIIEKVKVISICYSLLSKTIEKLFLEMIPFPVANCTIICWNFVWISFLLTTLIGSIVLYSYILIFLSITLLLFWTGMLYMMSILKYLFCPIMWIWYDTGIWRFNLFASYNSLNIRL